MRKVVIFIKYFVFCLVIGVPANIYGIYVKEFISNINGLTNNSVNCILEDSENVIWVGTWDGLNAYNYNEQTFTAYQHNPKNPHSLITNDVTDISPFLLKQLITSPEIYQAITDYLDGRSFGLLFSFPFLALRAFFVGITKTRTLSWSAIAAVLINIPFNYLLIFTLKFGIAGSAIASTLAEMVSLIILLIYMWRKIDKNKYGLQPVVDGKLLKRLFYLSVWSMLHSFISMAPWFLFFVAIEHLGKMELAVSNITRSVSTLFFVIVSSLGTTNSSLVSNLVGAGQRKGVFPICHKIIKMGYAIGLPLVGIALLCNYWIIRFYTNNETLVQHTVPPFIVMLFNYVFAVPGYVYISAVTGTGKTKIAFIFQMVTIMVYLLYLYWLSHCIYAPLAVYMTTEYLFVIMLGIQSVIYLKRKHY